MTNNNQLTPKLHLQIKPRRLRDASADESWELSMSSARGGVASVFHVREYTGCALPCRRVTNLWTSDCVSTLKHSETKLAEPSSPSLVKITARTRDLVPASFGKDYNVNVPSEIEHP